MPSNNSSEIRDEIDADGVHALSATEMEAVAGGTIMDIIIRAWANSECLKRLTREGTVIDCRYPARL